MLKKYLYPIVKNKKLKNWLKFWYLQGQKVAIKLIKLLDVTSPVTLNNTIKNTHLKIDILGNTSQDGTPTPENEVPIHVVKGNNTIYISKNEYTGNYLVGYLTNEGIFIPSAGSIYRTIYMKAKPNTKYYIHKLKTSRFIVGSSTNVLVNGSRTTNVYRNDNATDIEYITSNNANYINIYCYGNNEIISFKQLLNEIIISEEPIQKYNLSLSEGMEMCAIGNYADTFEKVDEKWYKNPNIIKKVFDGADNWLFQRSDTGSTVFKIAINNVSNNVQYLSNMFIYKDLSTLNRLAIELSGRMIYMSLDNQILEINNSDNGNVRVQKLKTWLSTNSIILYRIAGTPILEEITDQPLISQLNAIQKAKAYDEQTNIIITAEDLEPKLNIEYLEKEVIE